MKSVSIITRTKNRPITLKRTLKSIAAQTFKDFQWVIVNDGGAINDVENIAQTAINENIDVFIINNKESLGMEACSNQGIKNSASKYIAFLDDDDTWHPEFLNKTVTFLNDPSNITYKGVFTKTLVINEKFIGNNIIQINSYPFTPDFESVTLFHLVKQNYISNLSFVYHRQALETIGLYREDYPVVGDWEFNLRFLRQFDIGFIPEHLANYHRRSKNKITTYNQSDEYNLHSKYCAKLRNELLKKDFENNTIGLGFAINIGYELNQIERTIRRGSAIFILKNLIKELLYKTLLYLKVIRNTPKLFD